MIDAALAGFESHAAGRRFLPIRVPELVRLDEYELFASEVSRGNDALLKEVVRVLGFFLPHMALEQEFSNANAIRDLAQAGIELPPIREYFGKVVRYCLDTNWGRHAVQRYSWRQMPADGLFSKSPPIATPTRCVIDLPQTRKLKAQPQTKPENALVKAVAAGVGCFCDFHEPAQIADAAVWVELHIGNVGTDRAIVVARRVEMWRVGKIERLGAELHMNALGHAELAEQAEIEVHEAGTAEGVESRGSEAGLRHRTVRQRIIERFIAPHFSKFLNLWFYLVGTLAIAGSVQGRT
jgi:hypothetical protein